MSLRPAGPLTNFLRYIAAILGAAATAGLLGYFLDWNPRETAIICIAAMLCVATLLFYEYIKDWLAALIILPLILTSAGLMVKLETKQSNDQAIDIDERARDGFISVYPNNNSYILDKMGKDLEFSKSEIWLFGINFQVTAAFIQESILKALRRGIKVRFLVLDPESENIGAVAQNLGVDQAGLQARCRASQASIQYMIATWDKERKIGDTGSIEVRTFNSTIEFRGNVYDPRSANSNSYIVFYKNGVQSHELPGFVYKNGNIKNYIDTVASLWDQAKR